MSVLDISEFGDPVLIICENGPLFTTLLLGEPHGAQERAMAAMASAVENISAAFHLSFDEVMRLIKEEQPEQTDVIHRDPSLKQ